jgi:hypothetical protein
MSELQQDRGVERKLRGVWRRERLRGHLHGGGRVVGWAVALLLIGFLVDRFMLLSLGARMVVLAGILVIVGSTLIRRWIRRLVRYNRVAIADRIERANPNLMGLLLAYTELAGVPAGQTQGSMELRAIVRDQAIAATEPLDVRPVVELRDAWPPVVFAICLLLVATAVAGIWPTETAVYLQRLFGSELAYPTHTQIIHISGSQRVRQGDPVVIEATVDGVVPATGTIQVRQPGLEVQPRAIEGVGDVFAYQIDSVVSSFTYTLEIGDAVSAPYEVIVVPPPTLVESRVSVRAPEYTQLPAYNVTALNVEVPQGSVLEWELRYDVPLSDAQFIAGVLPAEPTEISADGMIVRFSRRVDDALAYRFDLKRRDTGFAYEDTPHRVYVRLDADPEVAIESPPSDIQATINKTLIVRFKAQDDYGLKHAWIVYSLNEGEEKRLDLGELPVVAGQESISAPRYGLWPFTWELRHDVPDLQIGDLIRYSVEVEDVRATPSEAMRTRSAAREVRVVSRSAYQNFVMRELSRAQERLADVHIEARKSRQALDAMKNQLGAEGGAQ